MAEIVEGGSRGHKGKKKARRMGVRMDMTPMVDVAFLLLTFFMLATTLTTPQVMEISLPPDNQTVITGESNLVTLRILGDQTVYWNKGNEPPKAIRYDQIRGVLAARLKENPKLATLIKINREAHYQVLVDVIDQLNLTLAQLGLNEKRFSLITMDDKDMELVKSVSPM